MKSHLRRSLISLLLLFPLPLGAQNLQPQERFHVSLDVSRFRGADDSTALVEVHYAVGQGGLTYARDSVGWSAGAELTLIAKLKDSTIYGDRWLVPHSITDTAKPRLGMNLVGVYSLPLGKGDYRLILIGRDRYALPRKDSLQLRLPVVPPPANRLTLSDIEFAVSIKAAAKQGPFYKNTLEVIPNVGGLFTEQQTCFFYLEAYNLLLSEDRSDLTMRMAVSDAVGKELFSHDRLRKRVGESMVLVDQFPSASFKSGTYTLTVALLDTSKQILAQSSRKFFVYNPTLGVDTMLVSGRSSLPLAVYASMEEPELDREFKYAKYETTDTERKMYDQLKGVDAKRKFLTEMWSRRSPGEREQYLVRVEYVNTTYKSMMREGYRSDRGRVYIMYGPPDDIERHPNESDMKPYEIWTFNNIQGGVEFDFVQRSQGGDFELVNSTHRNELHDDNWRSYAQTR